MAKLENSALKTDLHPSLMPHKLRRLFNVCLAASALAYLDQGL